VSNSVAPLNIWSLGLGELERQARAKRASELSHDHGLVLRGFEGARPAERGRLARRPRHDPKSPCRAEARAASRLSVIDNPSPITGITA
jgi:hypothetical protein